MAELDPIIHAQARLRIMATLASLGPTESLSFPRLQELLEMTAGNLSTHLRKLEEAGYCSQEKAFKGRTPVTYVATTRAGRRAFEDYMEQLRTLLGGTA